MVSTGLSRTWLSSFCWGFGLTLAKPNVFVDPKGRFPEACFDPPRIFAELGSSKLAYPGPARENFRNTSWSCREDRKFRVLHFIELQNERNSSVTLLAGIVWNADRIIVKLGPLPLRWYGLLFATGFVCGYVIMFKVFKREGRPSSDLDTLLTYMVVGTIVGARLGHCLFYEPERYLSSIGAVISILKVWEGGLASHGAAIGLYLGIFLYSRKVENQPFIWCLDRISIPVVLAGCFIRLGNFFNSEIIGEPTTAPWGVMFTKAAYKPAQTQFRHPAQVYESIAYFLIFLILLLAYSKFKAGRRAGLLHGLFLVGVFTARFGIEFVKRRQAPFMESLPISMGQVLSIPFIVAGVWLITCAFDSSKPSDLTIENEG
jgi:phosphatidylglycerol:prolipoprotein diacylglycerol transferase